MAERNYEITCPICKVGTLKIREWMYPQTHYEPMDAGLEVVGQTCECDWVDADEHYDVLMEVLPKDRW